MNKFTLKDKKIFDEAYSKLEFPLAEHSFSWIYVWECYKDIEWAEINGNLCLFLTFEDGRCVWGPILPGNKLKETLQECFAICQDYNEKNKIKKIPAVMYIPGELKEQYYKIEGFEIKEQNKDYIYKKQDIIGLKGDKYKSKRNLRNYFVKNHDFSVENYDKEKHMHGCLDLLERWKKQKLKTIESKDAEKLEAEINANRKVLEYANILGLKGVAVFVEQQIEGYSFGEKTNEMICSDFFEKTNLKIKGLSVFIFGELLKLFECGYVNAGEDWDVKYLEDSKMSYRPFMVKNSYMVEKA
jgi:uncharacterized protein